MVGCYLIDGIKLELTSYKNTNRNPLSTEILPIEVVKENIGNRLNLKSKFALRASCKNGKKAFEDLNQDRIIEETLDEIFYRTNLPSEARAAILNGERDTVTHEYPYFHKDDIYDHTSEYYLMKESTALLKVLNILKRYNVNVNRLPERYRLLYEWNVNTAKHVPYYWKDDYFGPCYSRPGQFRCYYYTPVTKGKNCCKHPSAPGNDFTWTEKVMETWRSLLVSDNILTFVSLNSQRKEFEDGFSQFRDFLNEYKEYINSNKLQLYSILPDKSTNSSVLGPYNKINLEQKIKGINSEIDTVLARIDNEEICGDP